jgi:hypothetical protein
MLQAIGWAFLVCTSAVRVFWVRTTAAVLLGRPAQHPRVLGCWQQLGPPTDQGLINSGNQGMQDTKVCVTWCFYTFCSGHFIR